MDQFAQRYTQKAFERDFPEESLDQTAMSAAKAGGEKSAAAGQPSAPQHPPMGAGDVGTVLMDTFAGLAKGAVSQSIGAGGDIRVLVDLAAEEMMKKILGARLLPTTEEMQRLLPQLFPEGVQVDPRRRQTARASESVGEFMPIAPIKAVAAVGKGAADIVKRVKFNAAGKRVAEGAK